VYRTSRLATKRFGRRTQRTQGSRDEIQPGSTQAKAEMGDGAAPAGAVPRSIAVRSRRQPALQLSERPFPATLYPGEVNKKIFIVQNWPLHVISRRAPQVHSEVDFRVSKNTPPHGGAGRWASSHRGAAADHRYKLELMFDSSVSVGGDPAPVARHLSTRVHHTQVIVILSWNGSSLGPAWNGCGGLRRPPRLNWSYSAVARLHITPPVSCSATRYFQRIKAEETA
jgi:hypothetical protein